MSNQDFYELFIDEIEDMYSAEHQIVKFLPKLIAAASCENLKESLIKHLEETRNQVNRIEKIFSILGKKPEEITCEAMQGLLKEADRLVGNKPKSHVLDAAIISAAQKVEHYEIASYGTLRSFAEHLELNNDIVDLLQESLDEEGGANKKLTKLADGTIFSTGVNKEAAASFAGKK